jgi:glycine cleavage system transcriptional repressor
MENLIVVILSADEPNITNEIFKLIAQSSCTILNARMSYLGCEVIITLALSGIWSALAKFEAGIPGLEKKYQITAMSRRTQSRSPQPNLLPYSSYIVAPDKPEVVHKIVDFLIGHQVKLHDLYVDAYTAPITAAPMLGVSVAFGFPAKHLIADFREHFIVFCDENNFDIGMEPQKS